MEGLVIIGLVIGPIFLISPVVALLKIALANEYPLGYVIKWVLSGVLGLVVGIILTLICYLAAGYYTRALVAGTGGLLFLLLTAVMVVDIFKGSTMETGEEGIIISIPAAIAVALLAIAFINFWNA